MTKKLLLATLAAVALAACGDDDKKEDTNTCTGTPFTQPAGTVAINFTVDDTANRLFADEEMEWKGAMEYDSPTRTIITDGAWDGPFAPLYDDGSWKCGGHEPENATAGDHKFGITVFMEPPATGTTTVEYGLNDAVYQTDFGNGWMWPPGDNGSFAVAAGATAPVTAQGLTIPAVGTTDLKITLDKNNLGAGTWSTATVTIKGSAWGWSEITLSDDGTKGDTGAADGIYTLVLSEWAGAGKPYRHTGLLKSGQVAEWNWVLNGVEYKDGDGIAYATGVTAATKAAGAGAFTDRTISLTGNNTSITAP